MTTQTTDKNPTIFPKYIFFDIELKLKIQMFFHLLLRLYTIFVVLEKYI